MTDPDGGLPPEAHEAILDWYAANGRRLPFRQTRDPYAILVSEAMAQQTQAARAGASWQRFMDRYPTVGALASATPADVLRAWQGLGYNRRALHLWQAARRIVEVHGGEVPAELAALEALPGVGPYTARAVAAIAFGKPVGAVDTNVRRVLGRIVGGDASAMSPIELQRVADAAVPRDRPGAWTHALMDLGATICGPRQPDCPSCPARTWCAYANGSAPATQPRRGAAQPPFPATTRWLRGQIVDRLRAASHEDWVAIQAPIGSHDVAAVDAALRALAREGLVELRASDGGSKPRRPKARLARLALV